MSDFFKKMKSVFVVTSEEGEPEKFSNESDSGKQNDNPEPTNPPTTISTSQYTGEKVIGKQSDQFYEILFGAMERNNQSGFDYIEFKKALTGLDSLPMDEKTKFLSAYAGASASGATATSLINSASVYIEVLSTESDKFKTAVEDQRNKQITNRENEINQLNNLISGKKAQMTKLQAEIDEHNKMLSTLQSDIDTSRQKIDLTIADFNTTYDGLVQKIRSDIDRIKTYITN